MSNRLSILIFSPLALENGRGGEISAIELASGLQKYFNITLVDTNITLSKNFLTKESILKMLKGLKRNDRLYFAVFKVFNKTFTFPYPWEMIKLYKKIKNKDI
ncbi:MAG: hypothetical protein ACW990_19550, partial [Promethearchaeota archaeon]